MQKIIFKFGEAMTIECASDDTKDVVKQAAFFAQLPRVCGKCGTDVVFFYRNPQGNEYYGLRCLGTPRHEMNFGIHKVNEGGGLFFKERGTWENAWAGRNDEESADDRPATGQDWPAEDARLDKEIWKVWKSIERNITLEDALTKRFGRPLEKLTINEKRTVLEGLVGSAAAGA